MAKSHWSPCLLVVGWTPSQSTPAVAENEKEDTGLALSFGKTQEDGEKDSEALSQGTGLQPWRQEKQRGSYLLSGNLRLVENLRYSHAICMILEV
eukprot:100618-Pelagomonas_calceolata.AAC.2